MKRLVMIVAVFVGACQTAPVGVRSVDLQPDSAGQCVSLCQQIGLPLQSVVIMANNVGCVCAAAPPSSAGAPGAVSDAAASGGGMAAILVAQQQQQAAAAQQASAARARR